MLIAGRAEWCDSSPFVATAAKNLQSLGFGLSTSLLECLAASSEEAVADWYAEIVPILEKMVGAHRTFEPFYPNFPKQVMEASDAELFFNAMTHYFGFVLSDLLGDPNLVVLPELREGSSSDPRRVSRTPLDRPR